MRSEPLDDNTRKRNFLLAGLLAVFVLVLIGLAVYWVSPEMAEGTDSLF